MRVYQNVFFFGLTQNHYLSWLCHKIIIVHTIVILHIMVNNIKMTVKTNCKVYFTYCKKLNLSIHLINRSIYIIMERQYYFPLLKKKNNDKMMCY